jgi:4-diphosphocytidyl-2-C-methyl-D-erythritol kinase
MTRTWYAPAKINLWLRVFASDDSGYHPLDTLFCAIDLCDRLDITQMPGLELEVTGADVGPVETNLAYRAAHEYFLTTGLQPQLAIQLHKVVPAGAGLGGGSSDAAAVLRALQELHGDVLPQPDLLALAARLGSDVPFFLCGSPLARARGRGELLEPQPALPARPVLLVVPDFPIATRDAYAWLDESGTLEPSATSWPALQGWQDVEGHAVNSFEPVLFSRHPILRELRDELRSAGAVMAMVSGSGSALFGVFTDQASALRAQHALGRRTDVRSLLTRTLDERTRLD